MVLQMEATECGAASLRILLAHHGRWIPLSALRLQCGVTRDGSKASHIVRAARAHGMAAKGYRKSIDKLREMTLPVIVFWQFNHFLVVEGFDDERVYLNDPAFGHRTVPLTEFERDFTGIVLTMEPAEDFEAAGHPPSVVAGLKRRLMPVRQSLGFVAGTALILAASGLAVPVFAQVFVDDILLTGSTDWLRPLLVLMLGTLVVQGLATGLQLGVLRRLRLRLAVQFTTGFQRHLFRLPVRFFAQRHPGELAHRVSINDRVAGAAGGRIAMAAIDLLMLVLFAMVMLWYDVVLTVVAVTFAVFGVWSMSRATEARAEAHARMRQTSGMALSVAASGLRGIESLKASGTTGDLFAKLTGNLARNARVEQELALSAQTVGALPGLMQSMAAALVLVVGGWRVMEGHLTIGVLIGFQALMTAFLAPVSRVLALSSELQTLGGDLDRLDDVLSQAAETPVVDPVDPGDLRGRLTLTDVTFGYATILPPLVEDLNLELDQGGQVALVGPSGSGKSTVIRMIAGLYAPWSGGIAFDGIPRGQLAPAVLQDGVSFVDQDILLFRGSIRDNLTLWDESVPEEALVRACRDCRILADVLAMPGGFDAQLDEGGGNLSGGQRQRLELARALVRDPAILLLDESTSALDARTEHHVLKRIRARGCTVIMVAHRLSTIRDSDAILVLDAGKVSERGTHDELWAADGVYASLIRDEGGAA